jgi:hypothetical protein
MLLLLEEGVMTSDHICKACGRYTGLWARDGKFTGEEDHSPQRVEVSKLIGAGSSGLGLWSIKYEWICDKTR